MELEELKSNWDKLSKKLEKQELLNVSLIEQMTKTNYQSRLKKVVYPEFFGAIICLIGAVGILYNFNQLDTVVLQVMGILSIVFLILLPIISFQSLKGVYQIDMGAHNYTKMLEQFAKDKIRFQKLQKLAAILSAIFMFVFIPTSFKLFANKDYTIYLTFWLISFPLCLLFVVVLSRWVLKHYNKVLRQAEELLAEVRTNV